MSALLSEIRNRCYEMNGQLWFDGMFGGYFVTPGERGIRSEAGDLVPGTEEFAVSTLDEWRQLVAGLFLWNPSLLA